MPFDQHFNGKAASEIDELFVASRSDRRILPANPHEIIELMGNNEKGLSSFFMRIAWAAWLGIRFPTNLCIFTTSNMNSALMTVKMTSLSNQAKEHIQHILLQAVESKKTPGLVFGATTAETELFFTQAGQKGAGDSGGSAIGPDSVFWICSQTKLVVVIALLQLVEQGKIQLDTKASSVLPEFANRTVLKGVSESGKPITAPPDAEVTIRQLLNHTSGLYYEPEREPAFGLPIGYIADYTNDDSPVASFCNRLRPLKFEPGTDFVYGFSLDIIGFIVERVSGQSLEEYFNEHIFSPLGIPSTTFYVTPDNKERLVPLSFRGNDGSLTAWTGQCTLVENSPDKVRLHFAGIGGYSSLRDYLALLRHLLQIEAGSAANPILKPESVRTFFQPTLPPAGEKTLNEVLRGRDYQWSTALCVNTTDWPGRRRKGSGWWYGWAGTYYLMDPESGVALVFGTQVIPTRDPVVTRLWAELEEVFYGGLIS